MKALNENWQCRRLYRTKSQATSVLISYYQKNKLGYHLIGITTQKKIGKAHDRNRARRLIRESFCLLEPGIKDGYDFVFVARTKTTFVKMGEVQAAMENHLAPIMKDRDVKKTTKAAHQSLSQGNQSLYTTELYFSSHLFHLCFRSHRNAWGKYGRKFSDLAYIVLKSR